MWMDLLLILLAAAPLMHYNHWTPAPTEPTR